MYRLLFLAAYIERSGFLIKIWLKCEKKMMLFSFFCLTFISTCRKVRQRKKYLAIKQADDKLAPRIIKGQIFVCEN